MVNSVDPDEAAHYELPHLALRSLLSQLIHFWLFKLDFSF